MELWKLTWRGALHPLEYSPRLWGCMLFAFTTPVVPDVFSLCTLCSMSCTVNVVFCQQLAHLVCSMGFERQKKNFLACNLRGPNFVDRYDTPPWPKTPDRTMHDIYVNTAIKVLSSVCRVAIASQSWPQSATILFPSESQLAFAAGHIRHPRTALVDQR